MSNNIQHRYNVPIGCLTMISITMIIPALVIFSDSKTFNMFYGFIFLLLSVVSAFFMFKLVNQSAIGMKFKQKEIVMLQLFNYFADETGFSQKNKLKIFEFLFNGYDYKDVEKYTFEIKDNEVDVSEICDKINSFYPELKQEVYRSLFVIAAADKFITLIEKTLLYEIAIKLKVENLYANFLNLYKRKGVYEEKYQQKTKSSLKNPLNYSYSLNKAFNDLGLSENASLKDVKKAYRKLVKKYHPDKNQGIDEKQTQILEEKFIQVKKAYDLIIKKI